MNPGTPLARWWGEYLRAEPGWADALPYSSIDSDHEVLFYVELLARGALAPPGGGDAPTLPQLTTLGFGVYRGDLSKNRLIVVISKKTGLVEEFAYREEFRRD